MADFSVEECRWLLLLLRCRLLLLLLYFRGDLRDDDDKEEEDGLELGLRRPDADDVADDDPWTKATSESS